MNIDLPVAKVDDEKTEGNADYANYKHVKVEVTGELLNTELYTIGTESK